jgi:hypothetical protein
VERLRWRAFQVARTLAPAGPPAGLGPTLARKVDAAQAIPVRGWLATERWRAGGGTAVAAPFESWLGAGSPVVPAVRLLDDVAAGRSVPPESIGPALAAAGLRPSRWELLALTTEAASAQIEAP